MKKQYWWASEDPEDIIKKLETNHQSWSHYGSNPFAQAWWRNLVAYYSSVLEANHWESSLGYRGEQGELIKMVVPMARTIIRQMVTLVTKQRLSFSAIAKTSDSDVTEDLKIANARIQEIIQEQGLDIKAENVAEQASVFGLGFFKISYRTDRGAPYMSGMVETQDGQKEKIEYEGDIEISNPTVFDVSYDARVTDFKDLNWCEIRTIKNRYDMIAQHPELESEILQVPPVTVYNSGFATQGNTEVESDDLIFVFEAYHKPTPAMPDGRMVIYADSKTVFYDGENIYDCLPIVAVKPEPVHGTGYGYPHLSNLLPAQEMFDHAVSAIATNQTALAVQSVLVPRGAELSVQELGGMNAVYYTPQNANGGGKPEAMQLTQSAPETFKFADYLKNMMNSISNLNSTIRGEPPAGLTSGTAIATMSANAIEFLNSLSKALDVGLEQCMLKCIAVDQKMTKLPREINIIGRNNKSTQKSYTGENLDIVKKIKINRANPLMQTLSGRADVAEKLLQTGLIKDAQMYFSVIEGKPVDSMFETELSENDLLETENEALEAGQPVIALWTDDHPAHIRKHAALLNDPIIRAQGDMVEAILKHMDEHNALARGTDPFLTSMVRTGKMPEGGPPPPPGMPQEAMGVVPPGEPAMDTAEPADDQVERVM